jgi:hypothetical protein
VKNTDGNVPDGPDHPKNTAFFEIVNLKGVARIQEIFVEIPLGDFMFEVQRDGACSPVNGVYVQKVSYLQPTII